ncbi:unnamed protein product [Ostreobium quekettii]|uniref:Choline transporter-like protein n=1 Tax=Ostreobium quekettii TaxID=121088 RepID=A0A8S1JGS5_9CHLO|nr:unnamed protein product [Ostreobium quekettii]|eukprot:evm.model.scf_529.3 EVM.evm.TU.scf_529.3   scf_529:19000-24676(-)
MGRGDEDGVPAGGYSALSGAPGEDLGEQRVFNYGRREHRDRGWTYAFAATMLLLLAGGIAVGRGVNKRFTDVTTDEYLSDYANCPAKAPGGRGLLQEEEEEKDDGEFSLHKFTHAVWPWLAITLLGSLALGLGYVKMFEKHPMGMMIFGAVMQVVLLAIMGIASFSWNPYIGIVLLLVAGVAVCIHMSTKRHFELCAQLFHVATKGLRANPSILLLVIVLWVALGVVAFVAVALLGVAAMNGSVVTNPSVDSHMGQSCLDSTGTKVACCVWQVKGWAALYSVFAVLACLWTFCIIIELRVFTIAGTITQWYFQPPGTSTEGTLKRSLGHGLGASFGSIVFGGMVLTILQILRFLLRMATNNRSRNMLVMCICMVIRAILMAILDIIEFLTRFATMWCAVKGDAFIESGRQATDMLKRNFMDTTFVWWFPSWVLLGGNLVFSLAWAGIMYLVAIIGVAPGLKEYALAFFITSLITAYLVLSLTASILLNLVETVYFCYAIDKDNRVVSNDEVHEVFQKLPAKVGVLVEQPEGDVMYAAPQGQAPPPVLPTV